MPEKFPHKVVKSIFVELDELYKIAHRHISLSLTLSPPESS